MPGVPRQFLGEECFFGLAAFGGKAKKTPFSKKHVALLLATCFLEAWGTKAKGQDQTTIIFLNKCGFLALVPQASKQPLGQQKHYGIILGETLACLLLAFFEACEHRRMAQAASAREGLQSPVEAIFDSPEPLCNPYFVSIQS